MENAKKFQNLMFNLALAYVAYTAAVGLAGLLRTWTFELNHRVTKTSIR